MGVHANIWGMSNIESHYYMSQKVIRSKYWCWTLNNYTLEDVDKLGQVHGGADDRVTYLVYGFECGEQGTKHLQGYIEYSTRVRASTVKMGVGERTHVEPRRGSSTQAAAYCRKDGNYTEFGTLSVSQQGRRSDLEEIQSLLEKGTKEEEISSLYFKQWCRYWKSFKRFADLRKPPRMRSSLRVLVLWGEPGTGKTRFATEYARSRDIPFWISFSDTLRWFDGYEQERVVILDDFRGGARWQDLLRLLDIYEQRVEVKGGTVSWNPEEIWITSNVHPIAWYPKENDRILMRRIHTIIEFVGLSKDWDVAYANILLNIS